MNATEKMKNCLKELRGQLQEALNKYRNRKIEIMHKRSSNAANKYGKMQPKIDTRTSSIQDEIDENLQNEYASIDSLMAFTNRVITVINLIINTYGSDRAMNYISLTGLIETLYYVYSTGALTIEEVGIIIGLDVDAGRRKLYKNTDEKLKNEYSIAILENYFAEDGTFKYNDRVEEFKKEIERLETVPNSLQKFLKEILGIEYERKPFARELTALLIESNIAFEKSAKTSSTLIVKRSIRETERILKRYETPNDDPEKNALLRLVSLSFSHEKAIKPFDICAFLHAMLVSTIVAPVSPKAISECLGMLVNVDYQNKNNQRTYIENNPREVKQLLEYFNEDGTFKENPRVKDFQNILTNLIMKDFKNNPSLVIPEGAAQLPNEIAVLLEESNEKYRQDNARKKREAQEQIAREELSRYYFEGRILEIPFRLERFYDILDRCGFSETEKNDILRYLDNRIQIKGYRVGLILDEEELQLYLDAKALLNTLQTSNRDYIELQEALKNLNSIADLISYAEDKAEREFLEGERLEVLNYLRRTLQKYGASEIRTDSLGRAVDRPFTMKPISGTVQGDVK